LAREATGVGRGPEIPVVNKIKTIPAHPALLASNIPSPLITYYCWLGQKYFAIRSLAIIRYDYLFVQYSNQFMGPFFSVRERTNAP
jgi:hypothetical protein